MILFVAHEAHRTGAPIALLNFLRWERQAGSGDIAVLVGTDGPLIERFRELAPVIPADYSPQQALAKADLVYANSTASHRLLNELEAFSAPVISHVHELRSGLAPVDVLRAGKRPDRYIAVSSQVRDVLVSDYPIAPDDVTVCEGFVWVDDVVRSSQDAPAISRSDLGIPSNALVVGAVGSIWPYKGPDLFVRLANEVLATAAGPTEIHFVWIGGTEARVPLMREWVDERRLQHRVHILGEVEQPAPLMATFDVFIVPSREDPFPLVLLEAGALGRCAVAFDAGGASQILGNGRGVLIEAHDVAAMAEAVNELLGDPTLRARLGDALALHIASEHDVTKRAPAILQVIHEVVR